MGRRNFVILRRENNSGKYPPFDFLSLRFPFTTIEGKCQILKSYLIVRMKWNVNENGNENWNDHSIPIFGMTRNEILIPFLLFV